MDVSLDTRSFFKRLDKIQGTFDIRWQNIQAVSKLVLSVKEGIKDSFASLKALLASDLITPDAASRLLGSEYPTVRFVLAADHVGDLLVFAYRPIVGRHFDIHHPAVLIGRFQSFSFLVAGVRDKATVNRDVLVAISSVIVDVLSEIISEATTRFEVFVDNPLKVRRSGRGAIEDVDFRLTIPPQAIANMPLTGLQFIQGKQGDISLAVDLTHYFSAKSLSGLPAFNIAALNPHKLPWSFVSRVLQKTAEGHIPTQVLAPFVERLGNFCLRWAIPVPAQYDVVSAQRWGRYSAAFNGRKRRLAENEPLKSSPVSATKEVAVNTLPPRMDKAPSASSESMPWKAGPWKEYIWPHGEEWNEETKTTWLTPEQARRNDERQASQRKNVEKEPLPPSAVRQPAQPQKKFSPTKAELEEIGFSSVEELVTCLRGLISDNKSAPWPSLSKRHQPDFPALKVRLAFELDLEAERLKNTDETDRIRWARDAFLDDRPHEVEEIEQKHRDMLVARGLDPDDYDLATMTFTPPCEELAEFGANDVDEFVGMLRFLIRDVGGRPLGQNATPKSRSHFEQLKRRFRKETIVGADRVARILDGIRGGGRRPPLKNIRLFSPL
jgi:hypothetical protein